MIQQTIAEFIGEKKPVTLRAAQSVSDAVDAMKAQSVDSVLVVDDDGRVSGIFTEYDFLHRVAATGRDPSSTELASVMTKEPETLTKGDCVSYAINCMGVRGFRNVPIVDGDHRPVAIITVRDVVGHFDQLLSELDPDRSGDDGSEWTDIGGG